MHMHSTRSAAQAPIHVRAKARLRLTRSAELCARARFTSPCAGFALALLVRYFKCATHSVALAHRSYTMAEFLTRIDTSKLVTVETVSTGYARAHCNGDLDHCVLQALSALTAAFVAPSYNLPIFLFGLYAQEATEAVESLKMVRDPSMRIPQLNDL